MKQRMYQVDAFTDKLFGGNPAAVCPLKKWLEDATMQKIALENNLSETAFFVKENDGFRIRWFTPKSEVNLCGHATLASAHVLFNHLNYSQEEIQFQSKSGLLTVKKEDNKLILNFPADPSSEVPLPGMLKSAFNITPINCFKGKTDYMLIFETRKQIEQLEPGFSKIIKADARGVIATATGDDVDFVSRFFAPAVGVNEDPVTGSAHTTLIPFWAQRLHKPSLTARQLSERGGYLVCNYLKERVEIGGQAVTYLTGEIEY